MSTHTAHTHQGQIVENALYWFTYLLWHGIFVESLGTSLDSDVMSYK